MSEVRDTLIAARKLIEKKRTWHSGDAMGRGFIEREDGTKARCAFVAVCDAANSPEWNPDLEREAVRALAMVVPPAEDMGHHGARIWNYNDGPRTKHKHILALFDRAIEAAA